MASQSLISEFRNAAGGGGMTKNEDVSWIPKPVRCSLKEYSTAKLVTELSKRDGVLQLHPDDAVRDLNEILWNFSRNRQPKPKILVVRE